MPEANNIGGYIGRMVEKVKFSKKLGTCAGVIRVTDLHSGLVILFNKFSFELLRIIFFLFKTNCLFYIPEMKTSPV